MRNAHRPLALCAPRVLPTAEDSEIFSRNMARIVRWHGAPKFQLSVVGPKVRLVSTVSRAMLDYLEFARRA